MGSVQDLPHYQSPSLKLVNPTPEERINVWTANSQAWRGPLSLHDYLEREKYLTTVPLACEQGVSHWILVDSTLPPNARPILSSCESLRKRAFVAQNGTITEAITHGIGSVFTSPEYRKQKYATRMLEELGSILNTWQTDSKECKFSILYSDIGMKFYAELGWEPFPSTHISLPPLERSSKDKIVSPLHTSDLVELCALDERYIREELAEARDGKTHVAIVPEADQMQWFHLREEFLCRHIFGKDNTLGLEIKGAISQGPVGSRVWAVWTRSFYGPLVPESGNVLHILRLVVEDEKAATNVEALHGILEMAQTQAKRWQLNEVELWNPTPLVKEMVQSTGLEHSEVIRDKESIPSLKWYGNKEGAIEWVGNEKFGWC